MAFDAKGRGVLSSNGHLDALRASVLAAAVESAHGWTAFVCGPDPARRDALRQLHSALDAAASPVMVFEARTAAELSTMAGPVVRAVHGGVAMLYAPGTDDDPGDGWLAAWEAFFRGAERAWARDTPPGGLVLVGPSALEVLAPHAAATLWSARRALVRVGPPALPPRRRGTIDRDTTPTRAPPSARQAVSPVLRAPAAPSPGRPAGQTPHRPRQAPRAAVIDPGRRVAVQRARQLRRGGDLVGARGALEGVSAPEARLPLSDALRLAREWHALGDAFERRHAWGDALAAHERAVAILENSAGQYAARARALVQAHNACGDAAWGARALEAAIAHYEAALALTATLPSRAAPARYNRVATAYKLGRVLLESGRECDAAEPLRLAARLAPTPTDVETRRLTLMVLTALERAERACGEVARAAQIAERRRRIEQAPH